MTLKGAAVVVALMACLAAGLYWQRGRILLQLEAPIRSAIRHDLSAYIEETMEREDRNIDRARQRRALDETAQLVDQFLSKAKGFDGRFELLDYAVSAVDPKLHGLSCEFGVAAGESINFLASRIEGPVHGFDSFEGLPESWRRFEKGTFKMPHLPHVRPNVVLHKGWFDQSLPGFKKEHPEPMAFMHMDADLYSSTKTVFDILGDRVAPGTVIVFDEYFNYPGWREGEYKAFQEFTAARGVEFAYIGYCRYQEQAAVKIRKVGARR